jgi:hypothetical protein
LVLTKGSMGNLVGDTNEKYSESHFFYHNFV